MDQPGNHAAAPGAGFHIAFQHDARINARNLLGYVRERDIGSERAFLFEQAFNRHIGQHPFGIAQGPHHESRIEFGCSNQGLLHLFVNRGFLGCDEARTHVHAFGAERQRRNEAAAIRHTA